MNKKLLAIVAALLAVGAFFVVQTVRSQNVDQHFGPYATQSKWASRSNAKGVLVRRDADHHPNSSASVWDTLEQSALGDPWLAQTFFDDFFTFMAGAPTSNTLGWIVTETYTRSTQVLGTTTTPSCVVLTCAGKATSAGVVGLQLNGMPYELVSSSVPIWYECRIQISSGTLNQIGWLAGITEVDTDAHADVADGIYFRMNRSAVDNLNINFVTESNAAETVTDTGVDIVAGTWIRLGFTYDGTTATPYVNGLVKATVASTTNIPTSVPLTNTFEIRSLDDHDHVMAIEYVKTVQVRE